MNNSPIILQLSTKTTLRDTRGDKVAHEAQQFFDIDCGQCWHSKVLSVKHDISLEQATTFGKSCLADPVYETLSVNERSDASVLFPKGASSAIAVSRLPGVTDDEGISAQKALRDYFQTDSNVRTQEIFSQDIYFFEQALSSEQLEILGNKLLGNKLIQHINCFSDLREFSTDKLYIPTVNVEANTDVQTINLEISDEELISLSSVMVLALNLEEMKAIQAHYRDPELLAQRAELGLPAQATDCELEVLAQTWSEHCKHKEFAATISYENKETGEKKEINSLFKTYIKGSTDVVDKSLKANGNDWLIKVFTDNAGVVRMNPDTHFVWKVETHNSPSALDPYGGAITGILGNNRDPLATGIGGAKLLFNTNVLCFGDPFFEGELLTGQLHPRRIFAGVREGIEDGGNKSGIPTINGSIVFDDRYRGKPLVYCGTGAVMPPAYQGNDSWLKPIDSGDRILMIGGRVGKDGIHGATFSSIEIDENSPASAVQIGSPITQKLVYDFMVKACKEGLIKSSTDNGAGGLSSSIGELATISNGAVVQLDKVPLKYAGLRPWEIFISESQERMTLVVETDKLAALEEMAEQFEVEMSDIGYFTNDGLLQINYEDQKVAALSMHFLHEGTPKKYLVAEYVQEQIDEPQLPTKIDHAETLTALVQSLNICSREMVIRQYDHEVKGKTVLKSLMGKEGKAPQDAAVIRFDFNSFEGVAVSNGILPRYGDIDAYEMSAGAFDEAVRSIISAGGQLPNMSDKDGICWTVNDNFCVPDSVYHPENNPDGKQKLAKLVQICEALYDMSTFFDIPLTSGKDSMKNDYKGDGVKISVPPTILYSMAAKMPDVRKAISSDFKASGDLIYQLGKTYEEFGASEFYRLFDEIGKSVPKVRKEAAKELYLAVMEANRKNLIQSSHDLSDGGLAVALAECCFGTNLGADLNLPNDSLSDRAWLYAESHSRFLVSVAPEDQLAFEQVLGNKAHFLGHVASNSELLIYRKEETLLTISVNELLTASEQPFSKLFAAATV